MVGPFAVCKYISVDYIQLCICESTPGLRHHGAVAVEKLTPERRRQMTRDALVEAAAEVFAQKGFHGASLEEIAEAAGFTRGAIYSNYGSKEELLYAVIDRVNERQLRSSSEAIETEGHGDPVRGALAAAQLWRGDEGKRSRELTALGLELRLAALRSPVVRRRLADAEDRTRDKIVEVVEREAARYGAKLRLPARDLADIARAAIDGLEQYALIHDEEAERYEGLVQSLFVLLAEGGLGRPERAPAGDPVGVSAVRPADAGLSGRNP
ncbi:MAG: TetR/AcrR family transcriptional regulator [Acidimicrobiales bacterium]